MRRTASVLLGALLLAGCDRGHSDVGPPPGPIHAGAFDGEVIKSIQDQIALISAQPARADLRRTLGLLYLANGGPEEATTALRQATQLDPRDATAWCFLGVASEETGDVDAAIQAFSEARALAPEHAPLYWRPGFWLLDEGRVSEAYDLFEGAAALERGSSRPAPDAAAHRIGRARCLLELDRAAEAIPILEELNTLVEHFYVDYLLAQSYRRAGRAADAARLRTAGASEPPSFPDPWMDLRSRAKRGLEGRLSYIEELLATGRLDEATTAIASARATWPENIVLLHRLADLHRGRGKVDAWVRVLKQASRLDPQDAPTHYNLAIALTNARDLQNALTHAHRAADIKPDFVEAWLQIGRLEILLRRLDGEEEAADPNDLAAALVPLDRAFEIGVPKAADHVMYGHMLMRAGRLDDAIAVLSKVTDRIDAPPTAWTVLSDAHRRNSNGRAALETAISGINRFPNDPGLQQLVERYRQATGGAAP
ncbi:MAG: tetratricopeptide repeat protein [Phycisphaerales bacterium]|jgi:predicted Zn-dependent protease|nr:tetratricopeptide repeat protein [Phycisphaerales bacterium]